MTVKQRAIRSTMGFVFGAVVLGTAAAWLMANWPTEFGTVAALSLFGYMVYFYYTLTLYRLEREQERIIAALEKDSK